jgi:hypothetical protein
LEQEEAIWLEQPKLETVPADFGLSVGFGLSNLPDDYRRKVVNVTGYYQMLAYLVIFDSLDEELAALPFGYRIAKTWEALEPMVMRERLERGDRYSYMNAFEVLVRRLGSIAATDMHKKYGMSIESS